MDTANMSKSDNPSDNEILVKLKSYLPPSITATSIYEEICNAKIDTSSLPLLEMLHKQLKVLSGSHITVAIASVTKKMEDILSSHEFLRHSAELCLTLPADVLIIMTSWKDNDGFMQSQIAILSSNTIYRDQIADVLLQSTAPRLDLQPMASYIDMENIFSFIQNNVQVVQKEVVSLIQSFLEGQASTPDKKHIPFENLSKHKTNIQLESRVGEKVGTSEDEVRRHINLAKAIQCDQFRTSQDRYDLAAVGMDAVISPSLSSDSDFSDYGNIQTVEKNLDMCDFSDTEDEFRKVPNVSCGFNNDIVKDKSNSGTNENETDVHERTTNDILEENMDAHSTVGTFVNNVMDIEIESNHFRNLAAGNSSQTNINSGFADLMFEGQDDLLFMNKTKDIDFSSNTTTVNNPGLSGMNEGSGDFNDKMMPLCNSSSGNIILKSDPVDVKDWSPVDTDHLIFPGNVDSPLVFSSSTSTSTQGQASKVSIYPEFPSSSCMMISEIAYYQEAQLPSCNSAQIEDRSHDKLVELQNYSGTGHRSEYLVDEGGSSTLLCDNYVDFSSEFDFVFPDHQLMTSNVIKQVSENQSQLELSVESFRDSEQDIIAGTISHENDQTPQLCLDGVQHIAANGGVQSSITSQNIYAGEDFDSSVTKNLHTLNNIDTMPTIKTKQSPLFDNQIRYDGSNSRSSHSPEVIGKSPRCDSLDSPQETNTPQNSTTDNFGVSNSHNYCTDLSAVVERLTDQNSPRHQFSQKTISNSGGDSQDEEKTNLNIHQHGWPGQTETNSTSQSGIQNTMSTMKSLMNKCEDIETLSENKTASDVVNPLQNEIALFSRRDTKDSEIYTLEDDGNDSVSLQQIRVFPNNLVLLKTAPNSKDNYTNLDRTSVNYSDVIIEHGYAGMKDLFSPVNNNKICTLEDYTIFEIAEKIVAQSVANALQYAETYMRTETRLRWNDSTESNFLIYNRDNHLNDQCKHCDDCDTHGSQESYLDIELAKEQQDQQRHHNSEQEQQSQVIQHTPVHTFENQVLQIDSSCSPGPQFGGSYHSDNVNRKALSAEEHHLEDLAIKEIAFELTNDLIQKVFENFQSTQDLDDIANLVLENKAPKNGKEEISVSEVVCQTNPTKLVWKAGLDNEMSTREIRTVALDISKSCEIGDKICMDIPTVFDNVGIHALSEQTSSEDKTLCNINTYIIQDDQCEGTVIESQKCSGFYPNPNFSSNNTLHMNPNPSMIIIKDEIMTFPERKASDEFITVKEGEETIHPFSVKEFSKSEDFPPRKCSRDENLSLEDSAMKPSVRKGNIVTGYLPYVDLLQGSLDVTDALLNRISDVDHEVVIGECFGKVDGEELPSNSYNSVRDDNDTEEGCRSWLRQEGHQYKHDNTFVTNVGVLNQLEHNRNSDTAGELSKIDNGEAEILTAYMYRNLEIHTSNVSKVLELQSADTVSEPEKHIANIYGNLEAELPQHSKTLSTLDMDFATESEDLVVAECQCQVEAATQIDTVKSKLEQKKKIHVSFSNDFKEESSDFIISSSRTPLKSPPPTPFEFNDSELLSSPTLSPEDIHIGSTNENTETLLSQELLHTNSSKSTYQQVMKEVYHTSVGRISITSEDDPNSNYETSHYPSSPIDQAVEKDRAQVGRIIQSAEDTISEVDCQLHLFDVTSHASNRNILACADVLHSNVSSFIMQSPDEVPRNYESCTAFGIASSTLDVVNANLPVFDLNVATSKVCHEVVSSDTDSPKRDSDTELCTLEQCPVSSHPVSFSQGLPIQVNSDLNESEILTSDPITSTFHVRNLSNTSFGSVKGAVYTEEWQDDDIAEVAAQSGLDAAHVDSVRKKNITDSSFDNTLNDDNDEELKGENENKEERDEDGATDLEWENDTPVEIFVSCYVEPAHFEESTTSEEQRWKRVSISGSEFVIDMYAVEPFKNVLSHGGYYDEGLSAILVFYGCNLPSRHQEDYSYVMDHLFHYVMHTLDELVADDYVIIYFHGSTPSTQMPSLIWLKRCYQSIDRRLKKNLKGLFLVHPSLLLRTVITMIKPFISYKFTSKLRYVYSLDELNSVVPMDYISIPEAVVQYLVNTMLE